MSPLFLSSLIVVPLSPPGKGVFIKAGGAGATLALSSHGDGVGWLGRPLWSHPRVACKAWLSWFFHHCGRPWGGVGYVEVFGQMEGGERERERNKSWKGGEEVLPLPLRVRGRRWRTMLFKTTLFRLSLWFFMNNAWNSVVLYKIRRFI